MLALFVGLASAQVGVATGGPSNTALTCNASVAAPPTLRSEGLTELIGDIVIQCTGGTVTQAAGTIVPTANFTVSLGTQVTSRALGSGSEALLFIDEPGTGLAGPGPAFAPNACTSPAIGAGVGGCTTYLGAIASPGNGTTNAAATCTTLGTNGVCTAFGAPVNVFQGVVSNNQVIFNGIPILAPVTSGFTRTFRITNVRANVNGLGGGSLPGITPLLASVSISNNLLINNPVQTAGFIQTGLAASVLNSAASFVNTRNFQQCVTSGTSSTNGPASAALLQFKENFATAFKTRVAATATSNGAAIGATGFNQNLLGTNYNSESGIIMTVNGATAGLADFGTRLKAVFNNIPAGVSVYVSTFNLASLNSAANGATLSAASVNNGLVSPTVAVMVPGEMGVNFAGLTPTSLTFTGLPGTQLSQVPIVNGSGTAVWEVVQANPAQAETIQFGVLYTYTGNQASNTPPAGTGTVNLSYAPTAGANTFTTTASTGNGSSLPIPRFVDTSSATSIINITLCTTNLLFPFVTNTNGFDTGVAIANTTADPYSGIAAQAGTCTISFFGGATNPAAFTTPNIASGTVYANTISTIAAGFQGYAVAVCNFQFAHGFAFVSDVGARNLAMGYLALILPGSRSATETLTH